MNRLSHRATSHIVAAQPARRAESLHRRSDRPIVSMPVLKAIKRMPWFPVAFSNFRFQAHGECVDNAESSQDQMIKDLYKRSQIEADLPVPPGKVAQQLQRLQQATQITKPRYQPTMETLLDPSADDIARLVREHGPVSITMAAALGKDQGADQYASHHAMVILCTFKHEGRTVALAMDGNDLQKSPLMSKVQAYADKNGLDVQGLTPMDLLNIQQELGSDQDVAQLPFRLVDLETMVANSKAKQLTFETFQGQGEAPGTLGEPLPVTWPNSVRWASDAHVKVEQMPAEALQELENLCKADPGLIEFHPGSGGSAVNRDE